MTRRQNRTFLKIGMLTLFGAAVMIIARVIGVDERFIELPFTMLSLISFICLGWLGIMPIIGTYLFRFDDRDFKFMYGSRFTRFWALIIDDPHITKKIEEHFPPKKYPW
jgi:hypothetical protein